MSSAPHVVVVGGGITGLTTAYRLAAPGTGVRVTLLESRDRLGGNIQTRRVDGCVVDGGPDAWVVTKPHATDLARELGLADRLIGTTAKNRRLYVRSEGALHVFPEGAFLIVPTRVLPFARTRLVSARGRARMALDLALPRRRGAEDESMADFVRRRLGREALDRVAEPLLAGIYAGDPEALSIRSTFPQLVELEAKHRSVVLGAMALLRARGHARSGPPPSAFATCKGGTGELVEALAAAVESRGVTVRRSVRVASIRRPRGGILAPPSPRWLVDVAGPERGAPGDLAAGDQRAELAADAVVITTPAHAAAGTLEGLDADLARELRGIPYLSTATVVLAYRRADVPHPLDAVGIIIPRTEGRSLLAATFVTSKWEGRAPDDVVLLRAFLGGHRDPEAVTRDDDELRDVARKELGDLVGVRAAPLFARVTRFERANPQPIVGHGARLARIRGRLVALPGLELAGAAYDGVGIPDCVRQAGEVAARLLDGLAHPSTR